VELFAAAISARNRGCFVSAANVSFSLTMAKLNFDW